MIFINSVSRRLRGSDALKTTKQQQQKKHTDNKFTGEMWTEL